MADIVDLNIYPTIETVDVTIETIIDNVVVTIQPTNQPVNLTITPNLITINVNQVIGGGDVESVNGQTGVVVIAIPTTTSDLTNDGADGVNPFITALDIPTTGQASTIVREVKNMTGATLTKGTVVFISGANGNKALVQKALATTDALSSRTFGLLQSNISNNGLGNCVIIGDLSGLDTSSFTEGDQLYLSGVTAGTYTASKILAPTHLVYVGKVTRSHPTLGQIEVGIQNGYELEEIHDVQLVTTLNNQILVYESSTDLWKNKNLNQIVSLRRNANNTSNNYINYCGIAPNGSAEATAVWNITRLTIAANGNITIATATNVAWINRESATYI